MYMKPPDPYQNSDGKPIYTMREFIEANRGLTRNEIINQEKDRSKTFLKSQKGGPTMRYVRNPHDGLVIDMRHMLIVGKHTTMVGNLVEFLQWIVRDDSGMNPQDFYSNGVGNQFYMQFDYKLDSSDPQTFTDQLYRFFFNPKVFVFW